MTNKENLRRGTGKYMNNRERWVVFDVGTGRWYAFVTLDSATKAYDDFENAFRYSVNNGNRGAAGIAEAGYKVTSWENGMTTDELWALIGEAANENNLCSQYDEFAKKHGGPPRPPKTRRQRISIAFPIDFDVPEGKNPAEYWEDLSPAEKRAAVQDRLDYITNAGRKITPPDFLYEKAVRR